MPGRFEFPRAARLLNGTEFRRVFDQRRAIGDELFRIHYADSDSARLGLAISRRVSPRAVVRNRIRRQIRERFRLLRPDLAPMDYVVLARPAAAGLDGEQLRYSLDRLWQRFIG